MSSFVLFFVVSFVLTSQTCVNLMLPIDRKDVAVVRYCFLSIDEKIYHFSPVFLIKPQTNYDTMLPKPVQVDTKSFRLLVFSWFSVECRNYSFRPHIPYAYRDLCLYCLVMIMVTMQMKDIVLYSTTYGSNMICAHWSCCIVFPSFLSFSISLSLSFVRFYFLYSATLCICTHTHTQSPSTFTGFNDKHNIFILFILYRNVTSFVWMT